MTLITFSDGKVVMRDGKVGTEQACCCGEEETGTCDTACGKTFTVNWSYNGVSGTLACNVTGGNIKFVQQNGLLFVNISAFCRADGTVGFACIFCGTSAEQYSATKNADQSGCPPDGDVGLACTSLNNCPLSTAVGTVS